MQGRVLLSSAALVVLVGCSGPGSRRPAQGPTGAASQTTPPADADTPRASTLDVDEWRAIKARGGKMDKGQRARDRLPALVALLGDLDPAVRDGIGYEVVVQWAGKNGVLDGDGVEALSKLLRAELRRGLPSPGESDATFKRSFAALALSVIASRDATAPVLSDKEFAAVLVDAVWYAQNESDMRGHTGAHGWCHAAAHTADLLKFLGRNSRVDEGRALAILGAIASIVGRPHGYILHHGEELRLTAAVLAVLRRGILTPAKFEAWLEGLILPLARRKPAFDPEHYAIQRNTTSLLMAMVTQLELLEARPPALESARATLLRVLRR